MTNPTNRDDDRIEAARTQTRRALEELARLLEPTLGGKRHDVFPNMKDLRAAATEIGIGKVSNDTAGRVALALAGQAKASIDYYTVDVSHRNRITDAVEILDEAAQELLATIGG